VFLVLLMAIVLFAAGVNLVMEDYTRAADRPTAWLLAAGPALYLLGMAAFRRLLGTGPAGLHLIVAAACLATAPIGRAASGEWQLIGLVAVLAAGLVVRSHRWMPVSPTAAPEGGR
jgi:low temperature requirement protein LtrA